MKIGILSITRGGGQLTDKLCSLFTSSTDLKKDNSAKTSQLLSDNWDNYDAFICIMAAGIVVRSIAPLLKDKNSDPAVLVLDEKGQFVISLLSGHIGGGNQLARDIADKLGAVPVITTSSDTLELVALDVWAKNQNLIPPEKKALTAITAKLVNQGHLALFTDVAINSLPVGLIVTDRPEKADIIISNKIFNQCNATFFRPLNLIIGTGCNRGTDVSEFETALSELFQKLSLSTQCIRNIASVDKKNDEVGLLEFARQHDWGIEFFSAAEINTLNNLEISFAALKAIGAIGVAEPSALLSANSHLLLCRKRKWKNVTMAVAQAPFTLSEQAPDLSTR